MSSHLRVFQLITALGYGGAENMVLDLVRNLKEVNVTVGYMESQDDLAPKISQAGATIKSFDERFRFDPRAFINLRQFLRSESFDIIHTHLPYAQTLGRIAAYKTDTDAIISTQHNVSKNYHPITRTSERLTRQLDSATVAVSNGVEQSFTGTAHRPNEFADHWCTIYNGIDVQEFNDEVNKVNKEKIRQRQNLDSEVPTLLNVGRYVPVKQQAEAIRAVALVDFDVNLLIVGDGPLKKKLRTLAAELDVADSVNVTGRVEEIHPYYAVSDVFVSPSRGEGLPITLLEAMAAELPVVATDIPGIREVVNEQNTGLLYSPGRLEELIANMSYLRDEELSQSYGSAGYQRVQDHFSVKQMASSYRELYEAVVSK